ncbi:MAG: hypothetical protein Q9190_004239 [Brigantiaea leucoxantha]
MQKIFGAKTSSRKALILGVEVTVGCRSLQDAQKICKDVKDAKAIALDVEDEAALDTETEKVDVVVSLIPYIYHPLVIKSGIRKKRNIVNTSYTSPAMIELEKEIQEAGITVMNEIGLDPGIDHLYAIKTIDEVHEAGGKIKKFYSYCGGLPAPEASANPLGYKFSWSARGMMLALGNTAKFYEDGSTKEVPGHHLMTTAKSYSTGYTGFAFVAYSNRDSTPFRESYRIPEANTVIRGTLRYAGFCQIVKTLVDMGFLSQDTKDFLKPPKTDTKPDSWKHVTAKILGSTSSSESDIIWAISSKSTFKDTDEKNHVIAGLRWIGLFSDEPITPRSTPLDTLCATLEQKMAYGPSERDLVFLQHIFEIEHKDGKSETRTSTLCAYGDSEGYSAMARLVGTPCGIAVMRVLTGEYGKGLLKPYSKEICDPIREELKGMGIEMVEETVI